MPVVTLPLAQRVQWAVVLSREETRKEREKEKKGKKEKESKLREKCIVFFI